MNSYRHAKLCRTCERGSTSKADIGMWDLEAIRSYAVFNISENLCPISRIVLGGHIEHEITDEVEQIEACGFHCCIKDVGGDVMGML